MIDFIRDPRDARERDALVDVVRLPVWQFALGALDERLSRIAEPARAARDAARTDERIAFRVTALRDGARRRGAGRAEARAQRRLLTGHAPALVRAARSPGAHRRRRARVSRLRRSLRAPVGDLGRPAHGARRSSACCARSSITPRCSSTGPGSAGRRGAERLDIRQGRLRLRFATRARRWPDAAAGAGRRDPAAAEVAGGLRDDRHVVILHRRDADEPDADGGAPRVLLAEVSAQAAAVVRALALAPVSFPPEAHDALAARLEPLQESVDVELPSHWTRTIGPADARLIARLELLASGALEVRLGVRPAQAGAGLPARRGAGAAAGRAGARSPRRAPRSRPEQTCGARARRAAGAGRELGRGGVAGRSERPPRAAPSSTTTDAGAPDVDGAETAPWCWRVGAGDPALHLVATLKELSDGPTAAVSSSGPTTRGSTTTARSGGATCA